MKDTFKKLITTDAHPALPQLHELLNNDAYPALRHALIAGGFPRDLLLGKEPRDIDIFVPVPEYPRYAAMTTLVITDAMKGKEVTVSENEYDADLTYAVINSGDMQFILSNIDAFPYGSHDGNRLVQYFDSPVCEAWMAPNTEGFEIHTTADFDQFHENKVLGLYPTTSGKHMASMKEKFPDYFLVRLMQRERLAERFSDDLPF